MTRLQEMIERLSGRADDSDLLALLATSREGRLYNAALARELRDVIGGLKRELHQRQTIDSAAVNRNSGCGSPLKLIRD
jgi:hypothetical protein